MELHRQAGASHNDELGHPELGTALMERSRRSLARSCSFPRAVGKSRCCPDSNASCGPVWAEPVFEVIEQLTLAPTPDG